MLFRLYVCVGFIIYEKWIFRFLSIFCLSNVYLIENGFCSYGFFWML